VGAQGTRGILNPLSGLAHFSLDRAPPPEDLALFVERFWRVRWDLAGQPPFAQEILPYPCVNVSFQPRFRADRSSGLVDRSRAAA